jgi:hypothetical protein
LFIFAAAAAAQQPAHPAESAGIPVRHAEGTVHGFLELRTEAGELIAHGDLLQVVKDGAIESRMVFHLPDSAAFDESVTFTQDGVFAMQSYHLVQRGALFPFDIDATMARSGRYVIKTTAHEKGAHEKQFTGTLDLPADVYNGMVVTIAKNVPVTASETVHIVAFTPEPRVIGLELVPSGTQHVLLGRHEESAQEFTLKPKLGAAVALFAKVLGKAPPDSHAWIVTDDVPAFVRFVGPMYMGAVWRLELASPTWPH